MLPICRLMTLVVRLRRTQPALVAIRLESCKRVIPGSAKLDGEQSDSPLFGARKWKNNRRRARTAIPQKRVGPVFGNNRRTEDRVRLPKFGSSVPEMAARRSRPRIPAALPPDSYMFYLNRAKTLWPGFDPKMQLVVAIAAGKSGLSCQLALRVPRKMIDSKRIDRFLGEQYPTQCNVLESPEPT